jgi:hypothetical protein
VGGGDIDPWERYERRWTDLSLKELENFADWMNRILGYKPTVIGGWAVYFYNPNGLGSRDIDIVIPTREMKYRIIEKYLANNGYEIRKVAFGVGEWVKYLDPNEPESETFLDVCTLQDKNLVHGLGIEVPWSIAMERQGIIDINGKEVHIPSPEALLVMKSKAARDRNYDVVTGKGDEFKKNKARKDRFDIISIISTCDIESNHLRSILSKCGFMQIFKDTVEAAFEDGGVLDRFDLKEDELEKLRNKKDEIIGGL